MAKNVLINILGNPASALAALEEVGIKAQETAKKTATAGEEGAGAMSKLGALAKYGAGALIVAGVAAVDMGNKLEDAHAMLVVAVRDAGGSMAALAGPIAAVDKRMESLGFTNAQTEQALAQMTIGLHSTSKAMDLMGLAANIAAARHIDLSTAALLVTKASEGQTMALRRAGIDLPVVASSALKVKVAHEALAKAEEAVNAILLKTPDAVDAASKAHAKYEAALAKVQAAQQKLADLQSAGGQIIAALSQRYSGQAAAAADTFSGRMEVMRARITDVGAKIGIALIPILEKLMTTIAAVVGWFEKHKDAAIALGAVIGGMLLAATVAWVASLSPLILIVGGVVLAVAGLIAIGTALYQHWDQVVQFLRSGFGTLAQVIMLGPFAVITLLALHWREVWDGMKVAVRDFVGFFNATLNFFAGLPGWFGTLFINVGKGIADGFIWGLNQLISAWDTVVSGIGFKIPSWVPGLGGKGFNLGDVANISQIPYLDAGGIVTGPTLAALSVNSVPEAVMPLPMLSSMMGGGGAGGGPSGDLVIQLDGREFGRVAGPQLRTWFEQNVRRNAVRGSLTT